MPASDRLYRAVVEQKLVLPDHPEMREHMANTIARHNRRGWRLDKPSLGQPNDSSSPCAWRSTRSRTNPNPSRSSDGYDHPLPRLRTPH